VPCGKVTPGAGAYIPVVRRTVKYRVVTTLERLNNRLTRALLRRGRAPRWFGLLEPTGRRTGLARHGTGGMPCSAG